MDRFERRKFLLGAAALLATPQFVRAQRADRVHRIGFVSPTASGARNDAFLQGLRDHGYFPGRNVDIEMRFAEGRPERLPALVDEVIRLGVDVLVVGATIGARAAKQATATLPIVFAGSSDPVAGGIVSNLSRPGGNITGTSLAYGDGFAGKWLELLREAAPDVSRFAVLWSSSNAAAANFGRELQIAARALKVGVDLHDATQPRELDQAFAAIAASGAQGLIVTPSPFAATELVRLVRFAATTRLPTMYFSEDFPDAGGLMSYGPSIADAYRRAAGHVDRVLKGAKPGELPVEQPTKFDLVVNAATVKALGRDFPRSIVVRADRVIR